MSPAVHVLTEYDLDAETGVCRACGPVGLKYRKNGSPRCAVGRGQQRGQTNRFPTATRDTVRDIKLKRGCADCGYNAHWAALDFDHLPGAAKVMDVAEMIRVSRPLAAILAEIEKCEVVCANCHRVRTVMRRLTEQSA